MRPLLKIIFLLMLTGGFGVATPSLAEGCKLDGIKLNCGEGQALERLDAMASSETTALLSQPLQHLEKFTRPADIEIFRLSLEKAWATANKAEKIQRRKMRQRKMSGEEFDAWSDQWDAALRNYAAGINFYRTLVWHGKTGKAAPKDD